MSVCAVLAAFLAGVGLLQCTIGWRVVANFIRSQLTAPIGCLPPITILRPLCGAEPLLEEALVSCFSQHYPKFQIVFGVQNPSDPALAILERVRGRFPQCDVAVVVDSTLYGPNRKVSNLINMLPLAKHGLLVISDSDIHVRPDFLERLVVAMNQPGTGLVTSLYVGLPPAERGIWERLGAAQITHCFLPGVLLSRALGRQDCLGSTAMLYRQTLARIGGFESLVTFLAEDNVLGQRIRDLGLNIGISDAVVAATVPEPSFRNLWLHETRWTRTIRGVAPLALAASTLQCPLFWALLAIVLSSGAPWSIALYLLTWLVRAAVAGGIDRSLRAKLGTLIRPTPIWAFPIRDLLSVIEIGASYCIDDVVWRGQRICARQVSPAVAPGSGAGNK
jgi:ceramide glucosyltransferase